MPCRSLLKDKVAIVTGAATGIGRAIALELATEGAVVVVNYRSSEAAAIDVLNSITSNGGAGKTIQADISKEEDARRLTNETLDTYGRVDILVNNAGIIRDSPSISMSADDWDTVIKTNLYGAFYCSKLAARAMMKQRSEGRIINIASTAGLRGRGKQLNYSASKAGMIGLTKTLARELANWRITVNAVAPGLILTDLNRNVDAEEFARVIDTMVPLRRAGKPEDVATAVAFLASDRASYITGQVICIDGGFAM